MLVQNEFCVLAVSLEAQVCEEEEFFEVEVVAFELVYQHDNVEYCEASKQETLLLVVVGEVYDVTDGEGYYGPGQGYSCFAGRDGSRAFVTGNFTKEGARADLDGLTPGEVAGVIHWRDFYRKEDIYKYLGKLVGLYYDENGNAREEIHESIERRLAEHQHNEDNKKKISTFTGFESRIIQHELDHLNGILFVDHLSRLKRDVIIRKMRKYKKEKEII